MQEPIISQNNAVKTKCSTVRGIIKNMITILNVLNARWYKLR